MPEKRRSRKLTATEVAGMIFDGDRLRRSGSDIFYVESLGSFVIWKGDHHDLLFGKALETWIWEFIMENCRTTPPLSAFLKEVAIQMYHGCPKKVSQLSPDRLSFNDGTFDFATFAIEPHSPEQVVVRRVPFTYAEVQQATCPNFERFIATILTDTDDKAPDKDLALTMQEIFGYMLMTSMDAAAAFFFVGEGANGKSKLSEVLRAMIGDRYVAAMTLETLTMRTFATSALVGKYVNVSNEEESKYMKSDKFKALVTGDYMTAEKKFGDPFEFAPQAKLVFSTNEMPTFDGVNLGIRRRIKIVPFNHTISKEERDTKILDKLLPEMPGIIRWALEGAKRLIENAFEFTESDAAKIARGDFEEESSSVVGFFRETYDPEQAGFQSSIEMYDAYKAWCIGNGKKPVAKLRLFKDLNRMFPALKSKKQYIEGRQVRGYSIGFRGGASAPTSEADEPKF